MLSQIRREIRRLASPKRAAINRWFFKTGPGEYGEGDRFVGLTVPQIRSIAAKFAGADDRDIRALVRSPIHEERLLGLVFWVGRFRRGDARVKRQIYDLYVRHRRWVNNWDLVDSSAEHVVGGYLADRSHAPLLRWAKSRDLWERRIAIVSTFHFIRAGRFDATLRIAKMLLKDPEDLIQKASGWMLREVGKRDLKALEGFLGRHHREMPRTMLRYAIERFPEPRRKAWLLGSIRQPGISVSSHVIGGGGRS